MRGINKVIIIGHLGQDPDVRVMPNGTVIASFSIATSEQWKDKLTGERKERTEWHRVMLYGKLAEIARDYVKKGDPLYIEGQLRTRKWQDHNGQDRYTTEVMVGINGVLQMLGSKPQGGNQPAQQDRSQNGQQQHNPQNKYSASPDFDDDIPFAPIGLQHPALLLTM